MVNTFATFQCRSSYQFSNTASLLDMQALSVLKEENRVGSFFFFFLVANWAYSCFCRHFLQRAPGSGMVIHVVGGC